MVFSAELAGDSKPIYNYGNYYVVVNPQPLVQQTTKKEQIEFAIEIKLLRCKKNILHEFLLTLKTEILNKVDVILDPLESGSNDELSLIGNGVSQIKIQPFPLFPNTKDPDKIVFDVRINIAGYNRNNLNRLLTSLYPEVMEKVNDSL